MRTTALLFAALTALSTAAGAQSARRDAAPAAPVARFDWYNYSGHDSVYDVHPAGKGEYLAGKIRSGGSGTWGSIPMPPQAISAHEAGRIAEWLAGGAR